MHVLAGLTIAKVLAACHAEFADLTLIDEPPGRLRAIEIACRAPEAAGRLLLDVAGDVALFSEDRAWLEADVLKLKVIRVAKADEGWLP